MAVEAEPGGEVGRNTVEQTYTHSAAMQGAFELPMQDARDDFDALRKEAAGLLARVEDAHLAALNLMRETAVARRDFLALQEHLADAMHGPGDTGNVEHELHVAGMSLAHRSQVLAAALGESEIADREYRETEDRLKAALARMKELRGPMLLGREVVELRKRVRAMEEAGGTPALPE